MAIFNSYVSLPEGIQNGGVPQNDHFDVEDDRPWGLGVLSC
jgi:hypothetical protein